MANDHMYRGMVLSRAVEFRGRGGKRGRDWREGEENWEEGAENWEEEGKAGKGKGKKKARWGARAPGLMSPCGSTLKTSDLKQRLRGSKELILLPF